jgi:hypothetical protein
LHGLPTPLDLWVVVYDHILSRPLQPYLDLCDVAAFWTWQAEHLARLEENFERFAALTPNTRRALGCYMWDYGKEHGGREIPPALMEKQCRLAGEWLEQGRIDSVIFLAGNLCDLDVAGVRNARQWIRDLPAGSARLVNVDRRTPPLAASGSARLDFCR